MKARRMTLLVFLVLSILTLVLTPLAHAADPATAVKMPDTPAARLLAGWLGALGTGNPEVLQRFFSENYSSDVLSRGTAQQRAAGGLRLCRENGGAPELAQIERSAADELVVLVRFPVTESWLRISVKVAPEPPHTVTQWTVTSLPPSDPGDVKRLPDEEIAARAEAYVAKLAAADLFSGSVVVAHEGKPIFSRACGLASRAHNVANRTDTKFNLGSMNKMFTAVAVAQLAEKGRLAFADPVGKHLSDYPNKAVAEKVTLHHLLTHTSGVGDYFNEKYVEAAKDRFRTVRDFFPLFVDQPLEFEPGSRFRYSNAGFMILGAVIEKVSGENYFDYVREHVYKPAGMSDTDAYEMDQDTPKLATGYTGQNLFGRPPAQQRLPARVQRRSRRRRVLNRRGLDPLRAGTARAPAGQPGSDRAGYGRQGGVAPWREIRLRLRGGNGQRPAHRRPQRRLPRDQLPARHLFRSGLRCRRHVQLRPTRGDARRRQAALAHLPWVSPGVTWRMKGDISASRFHSMRQNDPCPVFYPAAKRERR
jgi:CubicO group peptidase (beta-lactamase class C family)